MESDREKEQRERTGHLERKLMTMSARDYCEMQGKKLSDYTAKGFVCNGAFYAIEIRVGEEVEAVVDFRIEKGRENSCLDSMHYYGTALVPKVR